MLSAIGLLGLITVCISLYVAITDFSWPDLIVHFLFVTCFLLLLVYLYRGGMSSHAMFKYSLLTFGVTIILQNVLFPPPSPSTGFTAMTSFLAVAIIGALIVWYMGWQDVKRSKHMALVILAALAIDSSLYTWSLYVMGARFTSMTVTVISIWVKPAIAACIFACYIFRMAKKNEKACNNSNIQ